MIPLAHAANLPAYYAGPDKFSLTIGMRREFHETPLLNGFPWTAGLAAIEQTQD
jgi:hypothetical protein